MPNSPSLTSRELAPSRVLQGALFAALVSPALNAVVYLAASGAGVPYTATGVAVPLQAVMTASAVWVVPATIVLLLMNRFLQKPTRVFVIVATVLCALSMLGPLTVPGATVGTRLALCVAHLICGVVITASLVVRGRPKA